MSRSYHSTHNELKKKKKEKLSFSSYSAYYDRIKEIKGLNAELGRKKYIKKRELELRKAKKILSQNNIDWDVFSRARNTDYLSTIKILMDNEDGAVFPVSKEDINSVLGSFSSENLLYVKSIQLQNINMDEFIPGVWTPITLGTYDRYDDKIVISGLRILDANCSFLKHILFYYKVLLISTLSHEIIHNIDYNSLGFRKGKGYVQKHLSTEGLACALEADFYKNNIIPYVKENYKNENDAFQEWMKQQGVLTLSIEYWTPSMGVRLTNDGIHSFFQGIHTGETPVKLNLNLAQDLWFGEHFHQSLSYLDHILSEIDDENYDALKLKAEILCNDLGQYEKAEAVYSKFYTTDLNDDSVTSNYAYTKMRLRKYDDAYQLLLSIPLLTGWNLLEYSLCLDRLQKKDELSMLIEQLKTSKHNSKMSINQNRLYLMFIYASQKNYSESLTYYKTINFKELEWIEAHWAKYIAGKYMWY